MKVKSLLFLDALPLLFYFLELYLPLSAITLERIPLPVIQFLVQFGIQVLPLQLLHL